MLPLRRMQSILFYGLTKRVRRWEGEAANTEMQGESAGAILKEDDIKKYKSK